MRKKPSVDQAGLAGVTYVAATSLEYGALRRALPDARVVQGGIALANVSRELGGAVVSCGVAGGLRPDLPTGTLLVPREVGRPDGTRRQCDPQLVEAFTRSARRLGIEPILAPLLTADVIVNGPARLQWAAKGYVGVDMETGLIEAARLAAVRVVLDTPQRELSSDWSSPARAMLRPRNWPQALWLAREAPRLMALAARVIAGAQGIAPSVRI
jgi:hypothetical protein